LQPVAAQAAPERMRAVAVFGHFAVLAAALAAVVPGPRLALADALVQRAHLREAHFAVDARRFDIAGEGGFCLFLFFRIVRGSFFILGWLALGWFPSVAAIVVAIHMITKIFKIIKMIPPVLIVIEVSWWRKIITTLCESRLNRCWCEQHHPRQQQKAADTRTADRPPHAGLLRRSGAGLPRCCTPFVVSCCHAIRPVAYG